MKTIVICGSMKFRDVMIEEQYDLALKGNIVLLPTLRPDTVVTMEPEEVQKLVDMHKEKIRKADEVYIINEDDYMGEDTIEELIFAVKCDIPIRFYKWPGVMFNDNRYNLLNHVHTMENEGGLRYGL